MILNHYSYGVYKPILVYLPLWKIMEFVTWDDDIDGIPNWMESHEKFHGAKAPTSISLTIINHHLFGW